MAELIITPLLLLAISATILTIYFIVFTVNDYKYSDKHQVAVQIVAILFMLAVAILSWNLNYYFLIK